MVKRKAIDKRMLKANVPTATLIKFRSVRNRGNFPEGQSNAPFVMTAADHRSFRTTEKHKRKQEIERRIRGKKRK